MSSGPSLQAYVAKAFRWERGRQLSGYDKMLLLYGLWPLPFDMYVLRFPEGSEIGPHTDPVSENQHYRLNIVVWKAREGGEFQCKNPIYETSRIKYFRPDMSEHSVSKVVQGNRYVFSVGWLRRPNAR